jgi:MFS family permease
MSLLHTAWHDFVNAAHMFSRPARRILVSQFLVWMGLGIQNVLFNLYLVEAGFHEVFIGNALAALGIGLAVAAIPAGFFADLWGRRRCLLLGILAGGFGFLLRSCVSGLTSILIFCFLAGTGQSLFQIASLPFLAEHSSARERTHLFGAFFATALLATVVGSAVAAMLPSALLALPGSLRPNALTAYRIALVIAALCSLAGWLPLARLHGLRETSTVRQRAQLPPGSNRPLLPIAFNFLLVGCGAGLVVPFMNLYFKNRFICSSAQIGLFFSIAALLTAFASLLGPAIARRFGTLRTAVSFELLSLPFLVTMGAKTGLTTAVAAFWMRATFMQAGTPLLHSFVMEALPPGLRARSSSINNLLFNVGWALSVGFAGVLIMRWGYAIPFYITTVLYATAAIQFYFSFRHLPRHALELSNELFITPI